MVQLRERGSRTFSLARVQAAAADAFKRPGALQLTLVGPCHACQRPRLPRGSRAPAAVERAAGPQCDDADEYRANERKSLDRVKAAVDHLKQFFAGWRAQAVSTERILAYVRYRQQQQAANATMNRELAALKRMLRLGERTGRIVRRPLIDLLQEHDARTGFFEREEFDAVLAHLPDDLQAVFTVAYLTGWRVKSELLTRQWAHVDFHNAMRKIIGVPLAGATARAAVPARYMLERQDWQGAAQLQPLGTGYPMAEAITHFARAVGAARSGDTAAAQADVEKLKEQRATLEKAGQGYWAGQVEIQILGAQAWTAAGQGNGSDAIKFMRAAADLEDASEKHVAMENRLYPMRERLADMLLAQVEAAGALTEYETSLKNAPMRLRGFYGAAKAAEGSGDAKKAREYFEKLTRLTRYADGDRPELREAKQRLASK